MPITSAPENRTEPTRMRKLLPRLGALALTLGIPAALVAGTSAPASACTLVVSHGVSPMCGGGNPDPITSVTLSATPSAVGPGDAVRMTMTAHYAVSSPADVTQGAVFSFAPGAGSCTGNVCTPATTGALTITGTSSASTRTATTTLSVLAPDHLVVNPVYTTATAGQTITYTVRQAAADGTILDDISSAATVTLGGAPCPGAVCTATTAGQQTLTAVYDGMTAGGAVMVQPGIQAAYLTVTPHVLFEWNNVSAATFTAEAYDAGGNDLADATAKSVFTISPDGSCTHNSCTAATGGPHTVTAKAGVVSGSVTVDADGPLPVIATSLPAGQVGVGYSSSVLSSAEGATLTEFSPEGGGTPPPPGLTLGPDGVLSGTPTAAGTYGLRIESFNANGSSDTDTTITIGLPSPTPVPTPPPTAKPKVSAVGTSVAEGNSGRTTVPVTIRLSAASSTPVTVSWHTANGTAVAGKDYVAGQGTVTIPAGQLTATVPVSVIGDKVKEKNETFAVVLTAPQNATLGTARGVVTIANDD